jgi:hypothetical protein
MGNFGFDFFKKMAEKKLQDHEFFTFETFLKIKIARKKRNTVHNNISIGEIEFGVKRSPKGLAKGNGCF